MRFSLAFAALVAAVPAFSMSMPPRMGTVIPLTKGGMQMVDDQGVVNAEMLRAMATSTMSKMGNAFMTYERNMGTVHPYAMRLSNDVCGRGNVGSDPLVNEQNTLWHGPISVGTPPKNFTVDFDTGSSDLFLPGASCGATCQGHQIYDTAASSTAQDLGKTFSLAYGDGSTVQGEVFSDTVTIAGLTVTNQSVGAATQYSTGFAPDRFPPDGLMGMAFTRLSQYKANPFFQTLVEQGGVTDAQFGFKLAANDSELFLGGVNENLFTGEFTTLNVTIEGFWQVALDGINAGGQQAIGTAEAIIDTGTTLIVGPQADVLKIYQAIPGAKDATNVLGAGFYTFPCNTDPQVSLTFAGKQFAVPISTLSLGPVTQGSSDCVGGIMSTNGIEFWIVGDVFLSNYYTKFDVGAKQVGFATLA